MSDVARDLEVLVSSRYDELAERARHAGVALHDDVGVAERVRCTLLASDFAYAVWRRQPELLGGRGLERLRAPADASVRRGELVAAMADRARALHALRHFRHAEALRLVFRAVNGLCGLPDTLADTTVLYEVLLEAALGAAEASLVERFGHACNGDGRVQRLVVLGFGKLGGGELNFSSDIDLVLAYPESGHSDGRRSIDNDEYFVRLARELVRLLSHPEADGLAARVDLRLRPFGRAGRLALPFTAMEQYYQREGRDWERYAWIKARPVAGDLTAGRNVLELLRPFIYRRYLDYTALAGLREMKALIDAEVAHKDLADNLKLGPGGIREIEFMVQLVQLIRGGREPALRVRGLLPALAACAERGYVPQAAVKRLRVAYEFLRRLENRVQMLADAQTHTVPDDELSRERIARAMGYADWPALASELAGHRAFVSEAFAAVLAPEGSKATPQTGVADDLWQAADAGTLAAGALSAAGFGPRAATLAERLIGFLDSAQVRAMSARGRQRLQRLGPQVVSAALATPQPDASLARLLDLLHAITRRSAYLALLEERPAALRHLAEVFADSAFLASCVIAQPLLLDDVLDPRIEELPLRRTDLTAAIADALGALDSADGEARLERMNEFKASTAFRLGLAFRTGQADAAATARRLAGLAVAVVGAVLGLAEAELVARHGQLPGAELGFAVIGYGSVGGRELGFASDLDLVFLYDGARSRQRSDGEHPLDGLAWYQRLAQRVMHWLSTLTRAGRLYEVDTRLRPDGSKGLLVTSLEAFSDYQTKRAWTWEHQALIRARPIAGDPGLGEQFAAVRKAVLTRARSADQVAQDVGRMRGRWRIERDRSDAEWLDLKQGPGTLVDIGFVLQALVLVHAAGHPQLLAATDTAGLIAACLDAQILSDEQAATLRTTHALILARAMQCTLDAQPRLVARTSELDTQTARVTRLCAQLGLPMLAGGEPRDTHAGAG